MWFSPSKRIHPTVTGNTGQDVQTVHEGVFTVEFVPLLAMLSLVVKVIDFLRYAKNADWNGVITQLFTWLAGVVVLLLVAQTVWAATIPIGAIPLSKLGFWSVVFAGLSVASTASLTKDTLKSIDNHDSAALPTLLGARSIPPAGTPGR